MREMGGEIVDMRLLKNKNILHIARYVDPRDILDAVVHLCKCSYIESSPF